MFNKVSYSALLMQLLLQSERYQNPKVGTSAQKIAHNYNKFCLNVRVAMRLIFAGTTCVIKI